MPITFHLKRQPTVPLEAEVLSPDMLGRACRTRKFARSSSTTASGSCRWASSSTSKANAVTTSSFTVPCNKVRWIGRAMSKGSITVHGPVGMHLGAYMTGGRIEVHGHASDWIGAEMKNGFIHVHGNAGGQVGAAYRGSLAGMKNGTIIVDGSAGLEVGMRMRRGTIVIGGPARDFTGLQMKGGTIVLLSGAEIRTGAWMNRGTIISMKPLQLMPTFAYSIEATPIFLMLLARYMKSFGIQIPYAASEGTYRVYAGDTSVSDKGEILIWQPCT